MRLSIFTPVASLVEGEEVVSVSAEGLEGSFGILRGHIDYVSALVPGILSYSSDGSDEELLAVDRGVLVKSGTEIHVSVRDAVRGDELASLRATVDQRYRTLDERERMARSALATLESRFIRRFIEQARRIAHP